MGGHVVLGIFVLMRSGVQLQQNPDGGYEGTTDDRGFTISGLLYMSFGLPIWFLYAVLPCQRCPHLMPAEGDSGVGHKQYQDIPGLEVYECPISPEGINSDQPIWEQDRFLAYMHGNEHSAFKLATQQYDPKESMSASDQ